MGRPAAARPDRSGGNRPAPSWYVREWGRLTGAILGDEPSTDGSADSARAKEAITVARRLAAEATLTASIRRGEPLERAVCNAVAALSDLTEWGAAWSVADGAGRLPDGAVASALGHAIHLHRRLRQFDRVHRRIVGIDDTTLASHVPVEAADALLSTGSVEDRRRAAGIALGRGHDAVTLVDLAGRFLAVGDRETAQSLVDEYRRLPTTSLDDRRREALARIEGWLAPRPSAVPAGAVPIAILGYQTPDHVLTSGNLGDYIQTLAMVANLARFQGVRFTGDGELGHAATELQGTVRPDLRIAEPAAAVHLVEVPRDFSSASDVPDGTWLLAFGWHMHPLFDLRYDFPYNPRLRPIFVSFHVNRLDMLSEDALAYLRRYGPVGCRDWSTVNLLLSAGVDAFFTGCVTTTVDTVFPTRADVPRRTVGVVDLPAKSAGSDAANARIYSHQADAYRLMSAAQGVRAAYERVAEYQRDLARAVTGRLHAYLPLTSVGVPVDFRTQSPGDVRFAGLTGFTPDDPRLNEIRSGIRGLLEPVLARIAGGAGEEEVYGLWRELARERVADAVARFDAPSTDPPTTIDVPGALAASRGHARRFGPHDSVRPDDVVDVVLAFDQNLLHPAAVLLESIVVNSASQIRAWVLGRGIPDGYPAWLASAFPDVPITYIPCDAISYGPGGRPRRIPKRITISTMDRLLLPLMLPEVDRVLYLDIDTIVLDDVATLARTDLGGHLLGARDSNVSATSEWVRAGRHLEEPIATELRRRMARRDGFGTAALNAGVLVLDLERMRADDFATRAFGWVEHFGLNDQDAMLAYAGKDRVALDRSWNALPAIEDVDEPRLIHWASMEKPWGPDLAHAQDRWRQYAESLATRVQPFD